MPSETYKIYLLTNTQNDKIYVGYTSQHYVSERWAKHCQEARKGTDTHLYRAIRLYGPKAFSWNIIGKFNTSEEAKFYEREWIDFLRANQSDYGYNTTKGGEAPKHTEETKKKISRIQKENPRSPEFIANFVALTHTPEHRSRHSENMKKAWAEGKYADRNGDNHWSRRIGFSPESKAKLSDSVRRAWEEGRNIGITGTVVSEETRKKRSESMIKVWKTRRENATE